MSKKRVTPEQVDQKMRELREKFRQGMESPKLYEMKMETLRALKKLVLNRKERRGGRDE